MRKCRRRPAFTDWGWGCGRGRKGRKEWSLLCKGIESSTDCSAGPVLGAQRLTSDDDDDQEDVLKLVFALPQVSSLASYCKNMPQQFGLTT